MSNSSSHVSPPGSIAGSALRKSSLRCATSRIIPASRALAKRHARSGGASAASPRSFARRWDSHPKSGAASSASNTPSASCTPAPTSAGPSSPSTADTTINPTSPMNSVRSLESTPPPTQLAAPHGPTTSPMTELLPCNHLVALYSPTRFLGASAVESALYGAISPVNICVFCAYVQVFLNNDLARWQPMNDQD